MDFELSDEQAAFRDVIRDFVDKHVRPVAREYEHAGTYPTEIVDRMKEMGLFGITIPEQYGGLERTSCRCRSVSRSCHGRGWALRGSSAAIPCRVG